MTVIRPGDPMTVATLRILLNERNDDDLVLFKKDGVKVKLMSAIGTGTQNLVLWELEN